MDHLLVLIVMNMAVVSFTKRFFKGYGFETEYGFATYWYRKNGEFQGLCYGYFDKISTACMVDLCNKNIIVFNNNKYGLLACFYSKW